MVMLKLATDDPRKRYQAQQMQGIQAPRGVAPSNDPSVLQRASKIALDRGMDTVIDEGGKMAMKYGKPLFERGMSALMPSAAPTAESAIAANRTLLAGGIPTELTTGIMTGGAKAATGTGLMSGLGSMGAAAMASPLAPIVGGLALAKMFGFFSGGGQVGGPLASTQYKQEGGQVPEENEAAATKLLEELKRQLQRKEQANENNFLLPSLRSMGGPISYGGGPLNKGE